MLRIEGREIQKAICHSVGLSELAEGSFIISCHMNVEPIIECIENVKFSSI